MTVLHNVYSNPSATASWNPILGRAKGVFLPAVTNGSSSGSAIALAAGMCAGSIGAEICGSIVDPCRAAGLYGFKPTVGMIKDGNEGCIAISDRYDSTGPMGKVVKDLAILLDGMIREGNHDRRMGQTFVEAVECAALAGIKGARPPAKVPGGRGKSGRMRIGVLHPIPYTGNPPEIYNRIRAEFLRDIEILRTVPSFELAFEQASAPDASLGVPAVDAFCTRPDDPKCEWRQSLWDVRWEARWQAYRKAAHIHRAVDMYHHIGPFSLAARVARV